MTHNLEKYHTKNPLKIFFLNRFIDKIITLISSLPILTVLDAGCGEGIVTAKINRALMQLTLTGLDISPLCLNLAKTSMPQGKFVLGDIHHLPFADDTFDLIIALEVLEHLDNPRKALEEMRRTTKKYCLVSVPNEPFFSLGNLLTGKNLSRGGRDPGHCQNWHRRKFIWLFSQYFFVEKSATSFPWTIVLGKK